MSGAANRPPLSDTATDLVFRNPIYRVQPALDAEENKSEA